MLGMSARPFISPVGRSRGAAIFISLLCSRLLVCPIVVLPGEATSADQPTSIPSSLNQSASPFSRAAGASANPKAVVIARAANASLLGLLPLERHEDTAAACRGGEVPGPLLRVGASWPVSPGHG